MSNKVRKKNLKNSNIKKPRMFLTDKEYHHLKSEITRVRKMTLDFYKSIGLDENGKEIQSDCKNKQ